MIGPNCLVGDEQGSCLAEAWVEAGCRVEADCTPVGDGREFDNQMSCEVGVVVDVEE